MNLMDFTGDEHGCDTHQLELIDQDMLSARHIFIDKADGALDCLW